MAKANAVKKTGNNGWFQGEVGGWGAGVGGRLFIICPFVPWMYSLVFKTRKMKTQAPRTHCFRSPENWEKGLPLCQAAHLSACRVAGAVWVGRGGNWPVQTSQKHDPRLLHLVRQPVKPPGTGQVTCFKEKTHTCWTPYPGSALDSIFSRAACSLSSFSLWLFNCKREGGVVARGLSGGASAPFLPRPTCTPLLAAGRAHRIELDTEEIGEQEEKDGGGGTKPDPSWHVLLVKETLAAAYNHSHKAWKVQSNVDSRCLSAGRGKWKERLWDRAGLTFRNAIIMAINRDRVKSPVFLNNVTSIFWVRQWGF